MRVYGIVYASMFDENNVFLKEEDAKQFREMLAKKHNLEKNDPMLRIIPIDVHEVFDPNLYAPKKIKLQKEETKQK